MIANNQTTIINGVIPPIATPLLAYDRLDHKGLEKLVNHLIDGGVHGIFVLGTTGEFPSLSRRIRHELIEKVCLLVNQRIPVMVGITDTSMEESLSLAETAYKHGARGLVMTPPYYYPISQAEILEYFRKMAGSLPLPLYLYNIPSTTHVEIQIETVVNAAEIHGIVGIKDSTGKQDYFIQLMKALKQYPGFSVFMGSEEMMVEAILSGAAGCVAGGANVFPSLFVNLYEAVREKDHTRVSELQKKVQEINEFFDFFGRGVASYIRVMKGFLACLGICGDVMASPFQPLSDKEMNQIKLYIQKLSQQ